MKIMLSAGEIDFLKRKSVGLSQPDMARELGMSYYAYQAHEASGPKSQPHEQTVEYNASVGEYCLIMRRRLGLGRPYFAELLGVSNHVIRRKEEDETENNDLLTAISNFLAEREKDGSSER